MDREKFKRVMRMAYPNKASVVEQYRAVLQGFIAGSYAPASAPIPASATIACVGSCFSQEMAKSLKAEGKNVAPIWLSERWNTSFALHYFVARALEQTPFPPGYADGLDLSPTEGFESDLRECDAFILTFGLSACWSERNSGRMVLEIPSGHSPAGVLAAIDGHEMRQTTVAENVAEIAATLDCIRRHRPQAPIVLTLSPVPLLVSATDYPPVPSNAVSKATLRLALHQIEREGRPGVYYWPSYEMVEWMSRHRGPVWGVDDGDLRHVGASTVREITKLFAELFIQPAAAAPG